eukprot:COSAG05_NODE_2435_length_3067_cov_14.528976_1_plen_63_part_00
MDGIATHDLKLHVFDKTYRSNEGSANLKVVIHKLSGASPAAEQLAELAPALGASIDLSESLA